MYVPRIRDQKRREIREFFLQQAATTGQRTMKLTYQEIAKGSGVSLGTVVKGLKILEEDGFLTITRGPSRRIPNMYEVTIPEGEEHSLKASRLEVDALRQEVDRLRSSLRAVRELLQAYAEAEASAIVRAELPNGYVLVVRPAAAEAALIARRELEQRFVRRLLDRRTIGAALRRVGESGSRDEVHALVRRVRLRLGRAQEMRETASPRVQRVLEFVERHLLTLEHATDPARAAQAAQAALENLDQEA